MNPHALTAAQVEDRVARGQVNVVAATTSRSFANIVRANVLTRINAIYFALFLVAASTGYFLDTLFALLIVVNSAVGMVQEVRAKRTLDRLALVNKSAVTVIRAEGRLEIFPEDIVLDDVIVVAAGDQVPVDGVVLHSSALEVDESLLTGESDPVLRYADDPVMSGSVVVAGSGELRATAVGPEAYASRLAQEASVFRAPVSQLRKGIDKILGIIVWLLIPVGALTIANQLWGNHQELPQALRGLVAALVPMVPEGLVLMTSIAMAVGVVRLGRKQCLVQDLPAIEALARVDVLCVDKTGTLTLDGMQLDTIREIDDRHSSSTISAVLAAIGAAEARPNSSMAAILDALDSVPPATITHSVPFSSSRKWAAVDAGNSGSWVLGAPDVIAAPGDPALIESETLAGQGARVLALAHSPQPLDGQVLPPALTVAALVILQQRVREEAPGAIRYFGQQDVQVKVISGDHPAAVSAVATSIGLPRAGATIDARTLSDDPAALAEAMEDNAVFGRVAPEQKRAMVQALQSKGHTVAMTGDGVNDVLALKDADVGIAMGSGSPAARAVARIVLLNDSFSTLPSVVAEGRKVIANIERVATLFLSKTFYSVLLALLVAVSTVPFPFLPRHITLIAWFTIGIPAFVLALAPNADRARDGFVRRVLGNSIPSGIGVAAATFGAYITARNVIGYSAAEQVTTSTTAFIALVLVAFGVLISVARPLKAWSLGLVLLMMASMALVVLTPLGQTIFSLDPSDPRVFFIALPAAACGLLIRGIAIVVERRLRRPTR